MKYSHQTIKLSSGRTIPWLAFGNGSGAARQLAAQTTLWALESGFSHIDTAQGYATKEGDSNEAALGDAVKQSQLPRESLYLVTKISQKGGDAANPPLTLSEFTCSVHDSLRNLGGQPDLILIHSPMVCNGGRDVTSYWQALEKLKEDGILTGDLGISNFFPEQIQEIMRIAKYPPVCHPDAELEMHPQLLVASKEILELHAKYNIVTAAYGPLSPLLRHPKQGGRLKPVLERIATRIGAQPADVLLLWCKAKNIVAVTTSSKRTRIERFTQIDQLPPLTAEEIEDITRVGSQTHFRAYDEHMIGLPIPNLPSE